MDSFVKSEGSSLLLLLLLGPKKIQQRVKSGRKHGREVEERIARWRGEWLNSIRQKKNRLLAVLFYILPARPSVDFANRINNFAVSNRARSFVSLPRLRWTFSRRLLSTVTPLSWKRSLHVSEFNLQASAKWRLTGGGPLSSPLSSRSNYMI